MGLWTKAQDKQRPSNATNASVSSLSSASLHNHSRHNIHDPATTSSMELSPPPSTQPQQEPLDWGSLQAALRAGTVTADDEEHISKELVLTVQKLCQVSNQADQIRDDAEEEEDANEEMVVFEREEPLLRDPYSEKDPHHTTLCSATVPRL